MSTVSESRIEEHFGLVRLVINRHFKNHLRIYPAEYDDLFQTGCEGLLTAIRTYDPSRRTSFSTYATSCIWSSVMKYVVRNRLIKISRSVPINEVTIYSLDAEIPTSDKGERFVTTMPSYDDFSGVYAADFIKTLKPIHRRVLQMRMVGMNQAEIAASVGISQPHVSRILRTIRDEYLKYERELSA